MAHLAAGLILVGLGIWGMASWWSLFGLVMRGVIPFILLFLGMIAIMASVRRMGRSQLSTPQEAAERDGLDFDDSDPLDESVRALPGATSVDEDRLAELELMRRGLIPRSHGRVPSGVRR